MTENPMQGKDNWPIGVVVSILSRKLGDAGSIPAWGDNLLSTSYFYLLPLEQQFHSLNAVNGNSR